MILVPIFLILIGISVRLFALKELKEGINASFWRIVTPKKIVKTGLYKHIRHPMYLGSFFSYFGIALLLTQHLGISIMFLLILINFLFTRIDQEEQFLITKFGKEYIEYMEETKMILPYII